MSDIVHPCKWLFQICEYPDIFGGVQRKFGSDLRFVAFNTCIQGAFE